MNNVKHVDLVSGKRDSFGDLMDLLRICAPSWVLDVSRVDDAGNVLPPHDVKEFFSRAWDNGDDNLCHGWALSVHNHTVIYSERGGRGFTVSIEDAAGEWTATIHDVAITEPAYKVCLEHGFTEVAGTEHEGEDPTAPAEFN